MHAFDYYKDPSDTTGDARDPYLLVYPGPSSREVIDVPMYLHPATLVNTTDTPTLPEDADDVYQEFLDAYMVREQNPKNTDVWLPKIEKAEDFARDALEEFQSTDDMGVRAVWRPEDDAETDRDIYRRIQVADGEGV